ITGFAPEAVDAKARQVIDPIGDTARTAGAVAGGDEPVVLVVLETAGPAQACALNARLERLAFAVDATLLQQAERAGRPDAAVGDVVAVADLAAVALGIPGSCFDESPQRVAQVALQQRLPPAGAGRHDTRKPTDRVIAQPCLDAVRRLQHRR